MNKVHIRGKLPQGRPIAEILEAVDERLALMEDKIFGKQTYSSTDVLTNDEVMQYLGICRRTLQNWRDTGILKYTKLGKKIFYRFSDVLDTLEKRSKKSFN